MITTNTVTYNSNIFGNGNSGWLFVNALLTTVGPPCPERGGALSEARRS